MGMMALKCPQCGADIQLDDSREFGFCNYCGTKVVREKIVTEHTGTIEIDNSKAIDNLLKSARLAKNDMNIISAQNAYNELFSFMPDNWEFKYYSTYFNQLSELKDVDMLWKILDISRLRLINNIKSAVIQISGFHDEKEQDLAINEISKSIDLLYNLAKEQYSPNPYVTISDLYCKFGDSINDSSIKTKYKSKVIQLWSKGVSVAKEYNKSGVDFIIRNKLKPLIFEYNEKIQNFGNENSSVNNGQESSGGCYVATAVYGSYDCPEVWTLRRYRDNQLAKTWHGRLFIHTYYAISPTLVKWFGNTQWFKNMWKPKLDKMVDRLQKDGVKNTPYQDRNW